MPCCCNPSQFFLYSRRKRAVTGLQPSVIYAKNTDPWAQGHFYLAMVTKKITSGRERRGTSGKHIVTKLLRIRFHTKAELKFHQCNCYIYTTLIGSTSGKRVGLPFTWACSCRLRDEMRERGGGLEPGVLI